MQHEDTCVVDHKNTVSGAGIYFIINIIMISVKSVDSCSSEGATRRI